VLQPGWPCAGGATGSIRFAPEINHGANAGLSAAVALLQPVHDKFPEVSWADLIQMASAVAIEVRFYDMPRLPQHAGTLRIAASCQALLCMHADAAVAS
jgi:catalase (peroxidase I)